MSAIPKSKAKTAYGLLSEIRRLILEEPKRYDQTWWLARRGASSNSVEPQRGYPRCGTVGCVAGWVVTLKGSGAINYEVELEAQKILGLNDAMADQLFDASAVRRAKAQTVLHARAGAKHIEAFQEEFAAELKAKKL